MAIHSAAAAGFQAVAGAYARGRPDYPPELDRWIRDALRIGPGRHVLDLGAGTGKFTAHLAATGAHVIAVEPVEAMRNRLIADLPAVAALGGSAEAIPVPNGSVDAVVCAQAFHWFATPAALAEIHRVISPGGRLGLVWNARDMSAPWVGKLVELVDAYEGDSPRFRTGRWREVFPHPGFGPLEETRFSYLHTGPAEHVIVDRVMSTSFIGALPQAERDKLTDRVRQVIAEEPSLAGKPEVTFPYVTHAYMAVRL
jgi:SAM-dependent methyltransferase